MDRKNIIFLVVLVVLLLVSVVQAFQLNSVKEVLSGGGLGVVAPSSGGSGGASIPTSLQNLPGMVGGC